MNMKNILMTAGVLIAGVAGMQAQGPLYDKVIVDLPYSVSLNNTVLQPGHYVIRQLDSPGGGSRVLQIFTDNGMRLKTSAMTIPALDNNTPNNTKVILHHYGNDYYFDKIWIQGKNYGYEFPLPPAVKSRQRERMEPYTVAATYEQTNQTDSTTTSASSSSNSSVSSAPVASTENATPASTPAPVRTDNSASNSNSNTTLAQNQTPTNTDNSSGSNYSDTSRSSRRMPKTGGDWVMMLLSGGMLSGAGLLLRRSAVR